MNIELLKSKQNKIDENIRYAKEAGINKISAIMIFEDEDIKTAILTWLILKGYKVSLKNDEINVLTIEW